VNSLDLSQLRHQINQELAHFTKARSAHLSEIGSELNPVSVALSEFINDGGKRFRPIFAYLGYLAGGCEPSVEILRACTALELVHVCALIHDDVMDGSDTRRNKPAIHRRFENMHREQVLRGDAEKFGHASAILLGDLALVWADRMLHQSGISQSEFNNCQEIFCEMRDELMAGQYLDILEGALASTSVDRSMKVARYKSGKYSIERPLHFGAALADKSELFSAFSGYGLPLGEAFQLRDDLLGVFGNPAVTGKPAGDDLREGKRTVLIAMTMERIHDAQRKTLELALGNPSISEAEIQELQSLIEDSGAREQVEKLITELTDKAISVLREPSNGSTINTNVADALEQMAIIATQRSL
jgi:geranylgeranyl diphosphate synthase type I